MIYVETNTSTRVIYQHFMPFDPVYGLGKSEEELMKSGYLVDSVPEYTETVPDGKYPELHYDGIEFSWVLVDAPEEPETGGEDAELKQRVSDLEKQMTALTGTEG